MMLTAQDELERVPGVPFCAPARPTQRVVQVISHLDPKLGGISAVVPRLCAELVESWQIEADLCVFRGADETPVNLGEGSVQLSSWPSSRVAWMRDAALRNRFSGFIEGAAALHIHGLWEASSTVAARMARQRGKPYLVSAHGMLEPWALANKAVKKRVYAALLERTNLRQAACLHALTHDEAEDYRRFGCRQAIAVIPNGVDAPDRADPDPFLAAFPELRGRTILLFLGRVHFKKGLDLLLAAWARLEQQFPHATLVLAGPDAENSMAGVQDMVRQQGITGRVLCTGMLGADLKWSALAAAHCFVLPSYSEGLSVAVLEALSMGVPVIASDKCHVPEVEACGAGWVVKTEVAAVEDALRAAVVQSAAAKAAMGQRGRLLAREFRWATVAEKMAELYRWVAGGPKPTSFDVEGKRA